MTDIRPILDYTRLRPEPGLRLALVESNGEVRVLFEVTPRWVFLLVTVVYGVLGTGWTVLGISLWVSEVWERRWWVKVWPATAAIAIVTSIGLFLFASGALLGWRRYSRWSRDHQMLVATRQGLLDSRTGWFGLCQRWIPASEIASIELRSPPGSIQIIGAVASLYVWHCAGWRDRFYLSSWDPHLPRRIAERLAAVLGCPLK